jgi:23S rRNA (uracil1939-C5)-methyltransferase
MQIPGTIFDIEIDGLSLEGQGVGRVDGLVVFVEGLVPGDRARVRGVRAAARHALAVPVSLLRPSPDRVRPFCADFDRCGGCSLQHFSYPAQLKEKRRLVVDALVRIGGVSDADALVAPVVGMSDPFAYRAKVEMPVSGSAAHPLVGFYGKASHDVVDPAECRVQHSVGDAVRGAVRAWMTEARVAPYDERRHEGLLRHVVVRTAFATGQVMVGLVANGTAVPAVPALVERLRAAVETMPGMALTCVFLDVNRSRTAPVHGGDVRILHGAPTIEEHLAGLRFRVSPLSFFQVNPHQTELLYAAAVEAAALTGRETAYDLYCGTGTISLFLARKAAHVVGIESVAPAVEDARANAAANGIGNVAFVCGEAESVVPERYARGERADVVVVDPPRRGCDARLLETLAGMAPDRIVYVSCDPATMARDVARLAPSGYRVVSVRPVDLFPWTTHIETVVLMTRAKAGKA